MKVFDSVITSKGNRVKATLSHLLACFGSDTPVFLTDEETKSVEGCISGIVRVPSRDFQIYEFYDVTINAHRPNAEIVRVKCH